MKLEPKFDRHKSFYGKATVKAEGDKKHLTSYTTRAATVMSSRAIVYGTYSNTTLRHIKEFLLQNGFKADTKKQIVKDYMVQ